MSSLYPRSSKYIYICYIYICILNSAGKAKIYIYTPRVKRRSKGSPLYPHSDLVEKGERMECSIYSAGKARSKYICIYIDGVFYCSIENTP